MGDPNANPIMSQKLDPATSSLTAEAIYSQKPWYRRSGYCTAMLLIALVPGIGLVGFVTIPLVCLIQLTGPIYFKRLAAPGRLKEWKRRSNIVAAVIILALVVAQLIWLLQGRSG